MLKAASLKFQQNLTDIKDLILNKKNLYHFLRSNVQHSWKSKPTFSIGSKYPRRDGYENKRQLSILARAIIIYPSYHEVWEDLNDIVIEGCFY